MTLKASVVGWAHNLACFFCATAHWISLLLREAQIFMKKNGNLIKFPAWVSMLDIYDCGD